MINLCHFTNNELASKREILAFWIMSNKQQTFSTKIISQIGNKPLYKPMLTQFTDAYMRH